MRISTNLCKSALFTLLIVLAGCVCTTPGSCPDLVVTLDDDTLSVECPTGGGSCVTSVDVIVTNSGEVAAGAFVLRVVFDSGTASQPVDGLAPGESETFTVATAPGDNCFAPDCTACAIADDDDQVNETNESNNRDCTTIIG